MSPATVAELLQSLQEHQLLDAAQLEEIDRNLASEKDPRALADKLVRKDWLTPYQVDLLFAGRGGELVFSKFRLLELLGEGPLGKTFRAYDTYQNRLVTLELLQHTRLPPTPEPIRRFQREARTLTILNHANLVTTYEADHSDKAYYVATEFVEGRDLASVVKDIGPLPVAQACEYVRQAALALQHIHDSALMHRDVKPANLLLSWPGGAAANPAARRDRPLASVQELPQRGVVKLRAVGLIRLLLAVNPHFSPAPLTKEGLLPDTVDYIAPEQARDALSIDIRADIYSLGCTLYHLLTGQPPFPKGRTLEKLFKQQKEEPPPVEKLRPEVPPEVAATVRMMMAKRPEDRYQKPDDVAKALATGKAGGAPMNPVQALRSAVAAGGLSTLKKLIPAVPRSPTPPPAPPEPSAPARPVVQPAASSSVPRPPLLSPAARKVSPPLPESGKLPPAPAKPPPAPPPSKEVQLTTASLKLPPSGSPPPLGSPPAPQQAVQLMTAALLGATPAAGKPAASAPVPGEVALDSAKAKRLAKMPGHQGMVSAVAFAPIRDLVATGGMDGLVRLWDFRERPPRDFTGSPKHNGDVRALVFGPDSRLLASASGSRDNPLRLWYVGEDGLKERALLAQHKAAVDAIAFAPDGGFLAAAGDDKVIRLWDLAGLRPTELLSLAGHNSAIKSLACSPNGARWASGGHDGSILLWDLENDYAPLQATLTGHIDRVLSLVVSPDGKTLASGSADQSIRLWDLTAKKPRERVVLSPGSGAIRVLLYLPDGRTLASLGEQGRLIYWDAARGTKLNEWRVGRTAIYSGALTYDGRYVAVGRSDGFMLLFRVEAKQ
jgi:serine/threonine-protein kinase